MPIEEDLWRGRRVLLTGHTGFKGAWLSLWLQRLGAEVVGLAPSAPSDPSLYDLARVGNGMAAEHAVDVRDREAVRLALAEEQPEVVLHLAAQPMVRRSLLHPASTYEINVMGTVNLLEAVREVGARVRAVLVVTSDKCYENRRDAGSPQEPGRGGRPFREGDPLGGEDPYSSSKACAELVAAAYRSSFFAGDQGPQLATVRAGNVIGGGDWGEDRLLPDAVRVASGIQAAPLPVRNPNAVRPWQHVLNPLMGYLLLAQRLLEVPGGRAVGQEAGDPISAAWNFGPSPGDVKPVGWVIERLHELWEGFPCWQTDLAANPREAAWLALDSSKAERQLGWRPRWELDRGLRELVAWHCAHLAGRDMRAVTLDQIERLAAEDSERAAPGADAAAIRVAARQTG